MVDYERIEIWLRKDDPLLEYLESQRLGNEKLGRTAKRVLRRIMVIEELSRHDKKLASVVKQLWRRARRLGIA